MKHDNHFTISTMLNPVRLILWLGALFFDRAFIHYWVRQRSNGNQTTTEHYVRVFDIKIPLFTKIVNHLESENTRNN
jgi:hypothetical protein